MKKTIWKFSINDYDNQVFMPEGAKILSVQIQNGEAVLWALVDPDALKRNRMFRVFATGENVFTPEKWNYIGTFQKGWFVGHVFEWMGQ